MGRIVVVGSSNTDMVVQTPHLPAPGETVLGGTFFQAPGGKGANQAVAAARSGGSVTFIACVGTDNLGDQALAGFQAEGIDVSCIARIDDVPSGIALIVVDNVGENSIAVASGANAHLLPTHIDAAEPVVDASDVLLVQLESSLDTVASAVRMASAKGKIVIVNPAPARFLPEDVWSGISVLTPNRTEAALLSELPFDNRADADGVARALMDRGAEAVVLTAGADGAYVASGGTAAWVPGFDVNPIDTTGAGDVFNGALAVALSDGAVLMEAVRFANAAAALSVMQAGAQPSAPHRTAILSRLNMAP